MERTKLEAALVHAGVQEPIFLDEGAWHCAWKVQKDSDNFVLRIPKQSAYGKTVPYNEETLNADYGGTKLYYQSVN